MGSAVFSTTLFIFHQLHVKFDYCVKMLYVRNVFAPLIEGNVITPGVYLRTNTASVRI